MMVNAQCQRDMPDMTFFDGYATVCLGDALLRCAEWPSPTVIVADGPYGLSGFPGDPASPESLAEWYEPHAKLWYAHALPSATLWFWNSEQGWANCHRMLEACGWEFKNCHIWDKGIAHIAGNCNTKTIRRYPVVSEVCVQYTRKNTLQSEGKEMPLRKWLRQEWRRSGLPFSLTNEACGMKNAATRKYFTADHLWYFPPPEAFTALCGYANRYGKAEGRPYFSADGIRPMTGGEWALMRAKFRCEIGVSNVWREPAVRGIERVKKKGGCVHMNQKPLRLLERIVAASSDPDDIVWEPFGGLCSATLAAVRINRIAFAAEVNTEYHAHAVARLLDEENKDLLLRRAHEHEKRKIQYAATC
ncbi:MAG: site-specific DNA-methyltransferase [Kiritimatiellaeota bacterium]|nr:site-specific DNA-methyltransferase [Kiritimatiellota bacterium]